MEKVIETRQDVLDFLQVDEFPNGDGYGSGDGDGSGSGSGYVYGSGSGSGSVYGSGYGSGISSINGEVVYVVDGVQTLIESVHTNYARGHILHGDLTMTPCYIAKCGNYFAHGDTLKQAFDDAAEKYESNMPVEERIRKFNEQYPDSSVKIPAKELFSWHHILTGSCLAGRKHFCSEHGIDVDSDSFTVPEFITLTENDYGRDIIRQLKSSRT